MSGLLTFLLFGALFFFMMRFGCGSHAGHGGHGGHGSNPGGDGSEIGPDRPAQTGLGASVDPVCGMKVEHDIGYAKMHRGRSYRFCSRDCLDKFETEPDQYLGTPSIPSSRSGPER
jgi:YHS domain-containing protein